MEERREHPRLTRRGHRLLLERIERATVALREAQAQKGEATSQGGDTWHDNFAFEEAERQEWMLGRKLASLRALLRDSELVEPPRGLGRVQLGHRVRVRFEDGAERVLEVAGFGESDPARNVVTYETPLGRALIGARVGDERVFRLPVGERSVEVVEILHTDAVLAGVVSAHALL